MIQAGLACVLQSGCMPEVAAICVLVLLSNGTRSSRGTFVQGAEIVLMCDARWRRFLPCGGFPFAHPLPNGPGAPSCFCPFVLCPPCSSSPVLFAGRLSWSVGLYRLRESVYSQNTTTTTRMHHISGGPRDFLLNLRQYCA